MATNTLTAPTFPKKAAAPERRLPVGYGLLGGLAVSLAMWGGIIWAGVSIFNLVR